MIDRRYVKRFACIFALIALICFGLGQIEYCASNIFMSATMFMVMACIKRETPRRKKKDLMDFFPEPAALRSNLDKYDLKPEFATAVRMIYAMTPDEFIRFNRSMVELRYEADQESLKAASQAVRDRSVR